jgi:hypothetical protein
MRTREMHALERACPYLYALIISLFILTLAAGGPLYTLGNLHDAFIWLNAAYFADAGLAPNAEFATPLGPVYIYANLVAWHLTAVVTDIPFIVGLLFFLLAAALIFFLRDCIARRAIPHLLLFFFLFLVSGRLLVGPPGAIYWYGNYNRIGWALLFVVTIALLLNSRLVSQPTDRDKRRIAITSALIATLLFFIKFNFFVAFFGIAVGWALCTFQRRDWGHVLIFFSIVAACIIGASLGVSLKSYIGDILVSIEANAGSQLRLIRWHDIAFVFVFLAGSCLIDFLAGLSPVQRLRRAILWAAITVAILVASLGDHERPTVFLLLALCLRIVAVHDEVPAFAGGWKPRLVLLVPAAIIAIFVALDLFSVAVSAGHRLQLVKSNRLASVVWSQPMKGGKEFRFLYEAFEEVRADRKKLPRALDKSSNRDAILTELQSRAARTRRQNQYEAFFAIVSAMPDRQSILSNVGEAEVFINRSNKPYVDHINEGLGLLEKRGLRGKKIMTIAFANPFPALTGSPPPKGSPLWLHYKRNFISPSYIDRALSDTDAVMIPIVQTRRDTSLRKLFNGYNMRMRAFCRIEITKFWELYERRSGPDGNCPA